MNHTTLKAGLLAAAMVLPGAASASEPAPPSADNYSGSLAELATGARSASPQPNTIQSPRDPASGQATGKAPQGMVFTNDSIDKIQSPRDPASGQATGIQSPRDPATGQASGYLKIEGIDGESKVNAAPGANDRWAGGSDDGQSIRREQPQTGNAGAAATLTNASPGATPYREGGVNDTTHRTKQPRRNPHGRRGKRMHKP